MVEFITVVVYLSIYVGLVATAFYVLNFMEYQKKKIKLFSEKELPKVSVLIPAYNEEGSIARTIESILKTDYPKDKFEVIVINNNSSDRTYEIAKKYEKDGVKVYTEKKKGKGAALNLGISKAKGEFIFTLDADTMTESHCVRNMVHYFTDPNVMAVAPTMMVNKPKSIWQRVQSIEYHFGIFLRMVFANLGAIYVTPGAFSAYRKKFFEKHGGYDENNLTEDLEIALRIQHNGYTIATTEKAPVHTSAPKTFKSLLIQRRRWYVGHLRNLWNYRRLISKDYGDLGLFVIPIGIISIVFAIVIFLYMFFRSIFNWIDELVFLFSVGFDFSSLFNLSLDALERSLFLLFTDQIFIFVFLSLIVLKVYLSWVKKRVGKNPAAVFNLFLFLILFTFLFSFWWIVSIVYSLFKRDVGW